MKKILSFFMALCMICTLLPATVLTAFAADTEIVFQLGDNKDTTTHADGTKVTTYTATVDGYMLSITGGTNMYTGANDAKGNGCIKLGTSSKAGSFTISNIPDDVTSVVIAVAAYKAKTASVKVNGTTTALTTKSDNGAYDSITVDTSTDKTISFAVSSGYRAMVNSITFVVSGSEEEPTETTVAPACEHTNKVAIGEAKGATCTEDGITAGVMCDDCGEVLEEQKEIPATGHSYVDGICSVCGAAKPTGYVEANVTTLKDTDIVVITMTTSNGTTYALTNGNGTSKAPAATVVTVTDGVIEDNGDMETLLWNVVYNDGNITIYPNGTTDTWLYCTNANNGVRVGTNDNKVFNIDATSGYLQNYATSRYVGVYNSQDWRCYTTNTGTSNIANQTLKFYKLDQGGSEEPGAPTCQHTETVEFGAKEATCTESGLTAGVKCANEECSEIITEQTKIDALGHNYTDGACIRCGEKEPAMNTYNLVTDVIDLQVGDTIVIVSTDSDIAMSTTQNTNNRGQIAITKGDSTISFMSNSDVQVLTLETGMTAGTFAFNTGSGYLYAASSSGNQLKTKNTLDENGSWKIEITDGVATVVAQGDSARNVMQYNETSKLFACYASASQKAVSIYKLPAKVAEYTPAEGGEPVSYTSWAEALKNTTGTVKMFADLTAGKIDAENLIIDLNGKTLTVTTLIATVTDSSDDAAGLIALDTTEQDIVKTVAGQMLLWDNNAKGYRVFGYTFKEMGMNINQVDGKDDASVSEEYNTMVKSFWSDLDFTNENAYQLIGTAELKVGFKLVWNDDTENPKTFVLDNDKLAEWSGKKLGNTQANLDYYFYISVYGFANLKENGCLSVIPIIQDACGNNIEADPINFDYVAE